MSLTTKTLEYVVYNLPRGPAVGRGRVAQAAQTTARAEVPHAALAAEPSTEAASDVMPSPRFPPPWSVEELDACFGVKDGGGKCSLN